MSIFVKQKGVLTELRIFILFTSMKNVNICIANKIWYRMPWGAAHRTL